MALADRKLNHKERKSLPEVYTDINLAPALAGGGGRLLFNFGTPRGRGGVGGSGRTPPRGGAPPGGGVGTPGAEGAGKFFDCFLRKSRFGLIFSGGRTPPRGGPTPLWVATRTPLPPRGGLKEA